MMTQEEQRIALAERQFGVQVGEYPPVSQYPDDPGPTFGPSRMCYWHGKDLIEIPDYPSDLNAVHELENKLDNNQIDSYIRQLYVILDIEAEEDNPFADFKLVFATATQRCEALCRVLWPERWT